MLTRLQLIPIQFQGIQNHFVALDHFVGRKSDRDPRTLGVVLDQMHDRMDTAMDRAAVIVRITEILSLRFFLIVRHMDGMLDQLVDPLVGGRRDRNDRYAQQLFHLVDPDAAPVLSHLVHHIEGEHHGNVQLHQLHSQIHISLDVGRIRNIDDPPGMLAENKLSGDDLLTAVG